MQSTTIENNDGVGNGAVDTHPNHNTIPSRSLSISPSKSARIGATFDYTKHGAVEFTIEQANNTQSKGIFGDISGAMNCVWFW